MVAVMVQEVWGKGVAAGAMAAAEMAEAAEETAEVEAEARVAAVAAVEEEEETARAATGQVAEVVAVEATVALAAMAAARWHCTRRGTPPPSTRRRAGTRCPHARRTACSSTRPTASRMMSRSHS